MLALRKFREVHAKRVELPAWLAYDNPLTQLPSLRAMLDLDSIEPAGHQPVDTRAPAAERPAPAPTPPPPPSKEVPALPNELLLGRKDGVIASDLLLPVSELPTHAAFLGGTGSGKTTLVLGVIEQLLLRHIPVVLVDRKGDLTEYARSDVWQTKLDDPF